MGMRLEKWGGWRIVALAVTLCVSAHSAASAQSQTQLNAVCPADNGPPYWRCQVNVSARGDDKSPGPTFPERDKYDGRSSTVHARFVVDTMGRVRVGSALFLTEGTQFAPMAVRNSMPRWRYAPAVRNGVKVEAWVEETFSFNAGPFVGYHPEDGWYRDTAPDGTRVTTIGGMPRDSVGAARLSARNISDAQLAAAREILHWYRARSRYDSTLLLTTCLTMLDFIAARPPNAEELQAMFNERTRAVTVANCPRAYQQMTATVDRNGIVIDPPPRPKGYVDPVAIKFAEMALWRDDFVYLRVPTSQGTMGISMTCGVRKNSEGWSAHCSEGQYTVY